MKTISPDSLAALMSSAGVFAVFDVRERGEFNAGQIADATSLPRSQIEFRIDELVPDRGIPIVVYDGADGRANLAARTLADLGYRDVSVLDGGLTAWRRRDLPSTSGVNVPSKRFGERVHGDRAIPDISAQELRDLQSQRADLMVLDVRTPEEYARFCIPGGINVPGGDLVLWAEFLRQKSETPVIVNCAGRTRSIIGAAALRRLGLQNVRALRNGTMGWVLAGYELELRPNRNEATAPAESRRQARQLASRLAREEGIAAMPVGGLTDGKDGYGSGVTYVIDVRSEPEYAGGHIPGSIHVPGGQAVQRADDFIAVRSGRIVFVSGHAARAAMAAYWYRAMGYFHASFLDGGLSAWIQEGGELVAGSAQNEPRGVAAARQAARLLAPDEADSWLRRSAPRILHVGSSADFEAAHLAASQWISRGWIELRLPEALPDLSAPVLLSCHDGRHSLLAARTLAQLGYGDVRVLAGGVRAWADGGYPTVSGLDACLVEPNDVVLSPSIRGSKEDMKRYLEWELKLAGDG